MRFRPRLSVIKAWTLLVLERHISELRLHTEFGRPHKMTGGSVRACQACRVAKTKVRPSPAIRGQQLRNGSRAASGPDTDMLCSVISHVRHVDVASGYTCAAQAIQQRSTSSFAARMLLQHGIRNEHASRFANDPRLHQPGACLMANNLLLP